MARQPSRRETRDIGHVQREGPGLAARRHDLCRSLRDFGQGTGAEGDLCARRGEGLRHAAADPSARSGDQRAFAGQIEAGRDHSAAVP